MWRRQGTANTVNSFSTTLGTPSAINIISRNVNNTVNSTINSAI